MIIEFLVSGDEAISNAEHVLSCQEPGCDDIAHLYDRLTARYAGLADVFVFVAGTPRGLQYRLNFARTRPERTALSMQQKGSLASAGHGWEEAERGHAGSSA